MSELALYRKYRSASFDAVIGQPQVVDTLRNAIAANRLSHAYLFTGPRGTGKTSVARLLARAANCTSDDPAIRPCGECNNCKVDIGGHLDLIEIDAASNRGIDDARALREKISSAPSLGRYKVYIIDEVHMLTTEAFNALLKTLEEPPPHAIFIMATTEAHKLPETIVSRTQRFTFRPIGDTDIVAHLRHIATTEGVEVEDSALELLANTSRGGFRDAISLLDQVATSGISPLTEVDVRRLLGHSEPEILRMITDAVAAGEPAQTLAGIDKAFAEGVQAGQLAGQLIEHWRAELQRTVRDSPDDSARLHKLVIAIEAVLPVMKSSWPELSLESALIKLASGPVIQVGTPVVTAVKATPAATAPASGVATAPETPAAASGGAPDPELWIKALTQIKQKNNSLYALLRSCNLEFQGDKVIIGCKFSFFRDRLKEGKNLEIIEQTLSRVYGRKLHVSPQLQAQAMVTSSAASDPSAELMSSALEILGGEVVHD